MLFYLGSDFDIIYVKRICEQGTWVHISALLMTEVGICTPSTWTIQVRNEASYGQCTASFCWISTCAVDRKVHYYSDIACVVTEQLTKDL